MSEEKKLSIDESEKQAAAKKFAAQNKPVEVPVEAPKEAAPVAPVEAK